MKRRKNLIHVRELPEYRERGARTDAFYGEARNAMLQRDAEAAYLRSKLI